MRRKREEEHQKKLVRRLRVLKKEQDSWITKPAAWRGDVQVLEEHAMPVRRCEEKRKEWAKHWQCDSEAQGVEDKSWRNEDLRSSEEGLPRLNEENFANAARSYKAAIGVGCDGFQPKVP